MSEEQKKLDQLKMEKPKKAETGLQKAERANQALNLLNNEAFNRAYQTVFNRLLGEMLVAPTPKDVVISRDKMKLLDNLVTALNSDITEAELEAWRNQQNQ